MKCPRCNEALISESIKDVKYTVSVDKCPSCKGIWFERGELSRFEKIAEPTMLEIRKIPNEHTQLKALECPSCGNKQLMLKAEHFRDNKVIIDYCPECNGVWLDDGELTAIQKENWLITIGKIFRWLVGNE